MKFQAGVPIAVVQAIKEPSGSVRFNIVAANAITQATRNALMNLAEALILAAPNVLPYHFCSREPLFHYRLFPSGEVRFQSLYEPVVREDSVLRRRVDVLSDRLDADVLNYSQVMVATAAAS